MHLAENPHRATVILRPEPGLHQRMEEAERQKLEEVRRTLDAEAVQAIIGAEPRVAAPSGSAGPA